jgi:hypothetical protein
MPHSHSGLSGSIFPYLPSPANAIFSILQNNVHNNRYKTSVHAMEINASNRKYKPLNGYIKAHIHGFSVFDNMLANDFILP